MKLPLLASLALALLAATSTRADNYSHKEPFSRTAPFNANGEVSLHNINGDIVIETWDRNEILIEGEKSARTEEELHAIELIIDLSDSRADIKVHLPKRSGGWFGNNSIRGAVKFRLKVPAAVTLDEIKTVNSSIKIEGVRGAVTAHSVNGRVRADNLAGHARLRTVNGQVEASFTTIAAQQELSFNTVNGSIHVALPADAGLQLNGSVVNGHIDCDFPIQVQGRIGGKRLSGTIGDGRATLRAESVNGSIDLAKR